MTRGPRSIMRAGWSALNGELKDELLIVMRVYFEKPRTHGWLEGADQRSDIDGSHNIRKGLLLARRVLLGVLDEGVPAAHRVPGAHKPAVHRRCRQLGARSGARNTESQIHRQLASGLSIADRLQERHRRFGQGRDQRLLRRLAAARVLRPWTTWAVPAWSKRWATPIAMWCCAGQATARITTPVRLRRRWAEARAEMPEGSAAVCGLVVDCSHGNSGKDEVRQDRGRA